MSESQFGQPYAAIGGNGRYGLLLGIIDVLAVLPWISIGVL